MCHTFISHQLPCRTPRPCPPTLGAATLRQPKWAQHCAAHCELFIGRSAYTLCASYGERCPPYALPRFPSCSMRFLGWRCKALRRTRKYATHTLTHDSEDVRRDTSAKAEPRGPRWGAGGGNFRDTDHGHHRQHTYRRKLRGNGKVLMPTVPSRKVRNKSANDRGGQEGIDNNCTTQRNCPPRRLCVTRPRQEATTNRTRSATP